MYEKDGQPLEKIAKQFIEAKFVKPKVRPYRTNNYYAALIRQAELEREIEHVLQATSGAAKKKPERR